ncbi:activated cdc42 kinase 1 [Echinococcus multilocularis]|uniref:Activated cdc42 kinase 1 n=1 Tax=Echinococcus multilocularis TaxID=6211 RepID=A0A068YLT4_ECHMU|nr:activated cdc42 kinase 1 [Echinococcus multilocularis]
MSSKWISQCDFSIACEETGNLLKERSLLAPQARVFKRLRRTVSMPKGGEMEKPKVPDTRAESPPVKTDYFKGFNRAKSLFFHSCRLTKSEKREKSYRNPLSTAFSKHNHCQQQQSRPSVVSETDTVASSLSSDGEDGERENDDLPIVYEHPMLAELEAEVTVPPPPPRARPAWLKAALEKSRETLESSRQVRASSPVDIVSLAASVYSEDGSFLNYFDDGEDDGYAEVKIYPVLQNGVKISDTHYWVINPPKRRLRRWQDIGINSDGRPTTLSTKLWNDGHSHYENLPDTSACSSPGKNVQSEDFRSTQLRRGRSECNKEVLRLIQLTLVEKLQNQVPTARSDECRAVLIGSSWNFQKAQKRLKVELLCRLGCASKSACERILERMDWNFDAAAEYIRNSGSPRQSTPLSIYRPPLSRTASSTGDSSSVTPDNSPDILYLNTTSAPFT